MEKKGKKRYYKNRRAWLWQNGAIKPKPVANTYPSMGCWDRSLFTDVNGYPMIQSGQDIGIDKKFERMGERNRQKWLDCWMSIKTKAFRN